MQHESLCVPPQAPSPAVSRWAMQAAEEERLMEEFRKQGVKLPEKPAGSAWDSNIITPGTAFMHRLSVALQYYVHLRLNNDAGWRGITVGPWMLFWPCWAGWP